MTCAESLVNSTHGTLRLDASGLWQRCPQHQPEELHPRWEFCHGILCLCESFLVLSGRRSCHGDASRGGKAEVESRGRQAPDHWPQVSFTALRVSGHLNQKTLRHALAAYSPVWDFSRWLLPLYTTLCCSTEISAGGRASPQDDGQDSATDVADVRASILSVVQFHYRQRNSGPSPSTGNTEIQVKVPRNAGGAAMLSC